MHEQNAATTLIGAPVGLMFTIDRVMSTGSWLGLRHVPRSHHGARPAHAGRPCRRGVHAVPTASYASTSDTAERQPRLRPCRSASADPSAVENTLVTERERSVLGVAHFLNERE